MEVAPQPSPVPVVLSTPSSTITDDHAGISRQFSKGRKHVQSRSVARPPGGSSVAHSK